MTESSSTYVDSLGLVERVAALHRVELFVGIPGRVLAAVAEAAVQVRPSPGEVLMEEGAVEAHLYAIVKGRVRVHRGDRTIVELGPGTTVGELAALVPAPRTATVTASSHARPARRQGRPRRSPRRLARARTRRDGGTRGATARERNTPARRA